MESTSDEPAEPAVELFESPIPLPKRVAKRDVEYDYDVPEELMHYDYEE